MAEETIGDMIRAARERRGLSRELLAEQAGISSSVLKKIESGGTARIESYEAIAKALDASLTLIEQEAASRAASERRVHEAVEKMFGRAAPGQGTLEVAMAPAQDLNERVRKARNGRVARPLLTLVGGYAGSGKSEFGRALSKITGWAMIDKDVTARPMTEQLLRAHGGDPNDRHSELYVEHVRPLEYLSTMEAACRSLECGLSTVVTAPFLREMSDETWCSRLIHRCASLGVDTAFVWVDCDLPTMQDHIRQRSAARDAWKLGHWDEYEASVDVNMRPCVPHIVVDNRYNAATCLADQAAAIAEQAAREGHS